MKKVVLLSALTLILGGGLMAQEGGKAEKKCCKKSHCKKSCDKKSETAPAEEKK